MNAPQETPEVDLIPFKVSRRVERPSEEVNITITIPRGREQKLMDWLNSDTWEKANALREAKLDECLKSLEYVLNFTRLHSGTSGGRVFAQFLASLYNGDRVKADVSAIGSLDRGNFEHLMNAIRLCFETSKEPHTFFVNGGRLFEHMIESWGLEKKKRRAA